MPTAPRTHRPHGHGKRDYDRRRGTRTQRGYGTAWSRERDQLILQTPFCELCLAFGQEHPPAVRDHIIPHNGPQDWLYAEESNLWFICKAMHQWKTIVFDGGLRGKGQRREAQRTLEGIAARRREVVEAARQGWVKNL